MSTATASGAYDGLRRTVLARIESERLDPDTDLPAVRTTVVDAVEDYQRHAHLGEGAALRDPADMVARLLRSITAFGPLTDLLARPDVEEIFLEGPRVSYIDGTGRLQGLAAPTTEEENRQVVDRLLSTTQRTLDARSPLVQARVLNGRARLTAAIPPIGDALSATIRRHTLRRDTLGSLLDRGSLTPPAAGLLWAAMQTSTSVLVSGPPGAGKTSLLSALIAAVPSDHCVRCCEEIRELHVPLTHGSFYEARPPAMDGSGEVTLRDLVKFVLGMRPDHIVVGEVRGAEAFELTRAVNAGCGFACTVHANSARDALSALVNAAIMAGENVPEPVVRAVFAQAIDFVVHLDFDGGGGGADRPWSPEDALVPVTGPAGGEGAVGAPGRDGEPRTGGPGSGLDGGPGGGAEGGLRRQITEIVAVVPSLHDDFSTDPVFVRERVGAPLRWTGVVPPGAELLERHLPAGVSLRAVLEGRSVAL